MYYRAGPCFSKAYEECFGWELFQFGWKFLPNVVSATLNKDEDAFEKLDLVILFMRQIIQHLLFPQIYAHSTFSI